jgi:hypothetical protein
VETSVLLASINPGCYDFQREEPAEVLIGAMRALIEELKNHDMLCYSKNRNIKPDSGCGKPGLPTWASGWGANHADGIPSLCRRSGDLYDASGSM